MKISELGGETALIHLIRERYGKAGAGLAMGIGDDAALVDFGDEYLVVTTDLLVEKTHFRLDIIDPYLLGWKSVAVNISDIAAMGGIPTYSFISIGLPDVDVSVVDGIYQGIRDICTEYDSVIAGGDTVLSDCGIVLNVAQMGKVERDLATRRSQAKPGDAVIVTGTLGDSRIGLELLLKEGMSKAREQHPFLVERHLKPIPRVNEARAAVQTEKVHAMMDLSDGLSSDIGKLCEAAGVGARIFADELPVSSSFVEAAMEAGVDPSTVAAVGGEDYELLLTCDEDDVDYVIIAIEQVGTDAKVIGEVIDEQRVVLVSSSGEEADMPEGWKHF